MKTFQPKGSEIKRVWHLIDAEGKVLGRMATSAAMFLMGKNKATYSANIDSGDYVVVLNSEKVKLTGNKETNKLYRTHSGYPSGFKEANVARVRKEHPARLVEHAVSGMLPDNRLKADRMKRLKIVVGSKNPYQDKTDINRSKTDKNG